MPDKPITSSTPRAVARMVMLAVAALAMLVAFAPLIVLAGVAGSRARFRLVMALTPIFCRTVAWCIGLRVTIDGHRNPSALIFVGNHVSYLDILVAGIGVGGVFVSRHDVKRWPVIGLFARLAGTVFLDRGSLRSAVASSAGLVERASQHIRITVFPEGGTSSGDSVREFKPFLFGAVSSAGFLVQPFAIRYTHIGRVPLGTTNRTLVHWFDPAPGFDTHAWQLMKLPSVHARMTFLETVSPPAPDKDSVRRFAEELRQRVAAGGR